MILVLVISVAAYGKRDYSKVDRFVRSISDGNISSLDTLSSLILSNFTREDDLLRIVYGWICKNISYDMNKMGVAQNFQGDSSVAIILKSRKAVCSGYVNLFTNLSRRLGIDAYYVAGFGIQNGVVEDIGHAWVAVKLQNGQWKLFDPTWGAGVWHEGDLVQRLSYEYFMVDPVDFIKTHMPFDPQWQLLYQPIKAVEFYGIKAQKDKNQVFNFNDTIKVSRQSSDVSMYRGILRRMDWCGVANESAKLYYEQMNRYYVLGLHDELEQQKDMWLYAVSVQEQKVNTAYELYNELLLLEKNYKDRGVSASQVRFSSKVLTEYIYATCSEIDKLIKDEVADKEIIIALFRRALSIRNMIETLNEGINRMPVSSL